MTNQILHIPENRQSVVQHFLELLDIMDELRLKCPWDQKQSIQSLRHLTIEETFELSDSILENDTPNIMIELGDILLHIVFYSKIASETADFDLSMVIKSLNEKLIRRHPHIYGNTHVENEEDVKKNWEQIKLKEKGGNSSTLSGVPKGLPALIKAFRIQEKASGVGFDWENSEQVWDKVEEEIEELHVEIKELGSSNDNFENIENEYGDVIFALVNYARLIKVNPENALERTNKKFISRFNFMENQINQIGKKMNEMTLEEMDYFWNMAKKLEQKKNSQE
jgi:XTP/dITP diphosphohydrolase